MSMSLSIMDLIRFAVAVLIAATGAASLALFGFRLRGRDDSLLYFGLAAGMYGTRLSLEATHHAGNTVDLLITLVILIPMVLFLVETVAPAWKRAAWWIVGADLAVAAFAVGTRLLRMDPKLAYRTNNIVVLLAMPLLASMAFLPRRTADRDLQILRAGLIIFFVFIVYTNLGGLGILPGPNVEFIGFSVNLCCLGYVALARTRRNEEHLRMLHKELEIAREIQAQLLPQSSSAVAGAVIASRYVPASSVAGDFYDFLVKDGGVGVLIADVSGHGIPAALSASMVKVAVRAQMERAGDPAEVLRGMNSILCGNLQGQFVSAGYLFLEPAQGLLTYSGAGHPPLLVWRAATRQVDSLEENGLLLGIFAGSAYTARSIPLARGDRCLLYTDGLVEAPCSSGEEFGSNRLRDFLAQHSSLAPQPFCDALVQGLSRWCGPARPLPDDVTVVAIDMF
jgi:sigma-B regulation protein RsbU (phosphoserine phosphatase)